MPSCAVITCRVRSQEVCRSKGGISFHIFPKEPPHIRKKWIEATGREDWIPTKTSTICSRHFNENDYTKAKHKTLKENVIPHIKVCSHFFQNENTTPSPSPLGLRIKVLKDVITAKDSKINRQKKLIKKMLSQNRQYKKTIHKLENNMKDLQQKITLQNKDLTVQKLIINSIVTPSETSPTTSKETLITTTNNAESTSSIDILHLMPDTENNDPDILFLNRLLPDMQKLNHTQKEDFKQGIMQLYKNITFSATTEIAIKEEYQHTFYEEIDIQFSPKRSMSPD